MAAPRAPAHAATVRLHSCSAGGDEVGGGSGGSGGGSEGEPSEGGGSLGETAAARLAARVGRLVRRRCRCRRELLGGSSIAGQTGRLGATPG